MEGSRQRLTSIWIGMVALQGAGLGGYGNPFYHRIYRVFLSKLIRHVLPVGTRIRARGIYFASRCKCCREPSEESTVHLFIASEVAREVWSCFAHILGIPSSYRSVLQALHIWMAWASSSSQHCLCRMAFSAYIFWEICVSCCSATYGDSVMSAREICWNVIHRVRMLNLVIKPTWASTAVQTSTFKSNWQATRMKRGLWCKWDRPRPGQFKLNVDVLARDSNTTWGGIIRNHQGELMVGFPSFYGPGINNYAEFLALKEGLLLCKTLHLSPVLIESDSMLIVSAFFLRSAKVDNSSLSHIFKESLQLYTSDFEIVHGYR